MTVRIMNPEAVLFETAHGISAVLPAEGEQISVGDGHQPLVVALEEGVVSVLRSEGAAKVADDFLISRGLAHISHENVLTLFVEGGQTGKGGV